MKEVEHERRDWIIVAIILLFGLLLVLFAGKWATRFAPLWELNADMGSRLNPDSDYLTNRPNALIPVVNPAILTEPVWMDFYLTPDAVIPTQPRPADTSTPTSEPTHIPPTSTDVPTGTPTSTPIVVFPTNTSIPKPGSTSTATPTGIPAATSTSTPTATATPLPEANLLVTIDDNATNYVAGNAVQYTIVVSNPVGPSAVIGAQVAATFSSNLTNVTWTCTGVNGATCTASGSGNISDTVNLPVGNTAYIIYTVDAETGSSATGDLISGAEVATPAGITETDSSDNVSTDTDHIIVYTNLPVGNIGIGKDSYIDTVAPGTSITIAFDPPIHVGGHSGYDLVMYELPNGTGIAMDVLTLEISDGYNWYTILVWGDTNSDIYSNMNTNVVGGLETDNRDFTYIPVSNVLYPFNSGTIANPSTGIVFDLDLYPLLPKGVNYPYLRIGSPSAGNIDAGCEIDGFEILP